MTNTTDTIRNTARELRGKLVELEIQARQIADQMIADGVDESDAEDLRAALQESAWALESEGL
jgi:hypothetical protein